MATVFLRRLAHDDKPAARAHAVKRLRDGGASPDVHVVDPESFRQVPRAPFAYCVSGKVRRLFAELPSFESEGRNSPPWSVAPCAPQAPIRFRVLPPLSDRTIVGRHGPTCSGAAVHESLRQYLEDKLLAPSRPPSDRTPWLDPVSLPAIR